MVSTVSVDALTVLPLTVLAIRFTSPARIPPPPKIAGTQYDVSASISHVLPVTVLPEIELAKPYMYFAYTPPPATSAVLPETVDSIVSKA